MKYIAPIAVIAVLLLQFTDAIPKSSVGGPMTIAMVVFPAVLAVGMHEAWLNKRGVLGWIVSIIVALAGVLLAAEFGDLIFGTILSLLKFEGAPVSAGGLVPYVALTAFTLYALFGAWLTLRIVSRWR